MTADTKRDPPPLYRPLTPQEAKVAALIAQGDGYALIALKLGISPFTVRNHVHRIADQLPPDELPAKRRVRKWLQNVKRSA